MFKPLSVGTHVIEMGLSLDGEAPDPDDSSTITVRVKGKRH
jgi:hypothetical protein